VSEKGTSQSFFETLCGRSSCASDFWLIGPSPHAAPRPCLSVQPGCSSTLDFCSANWSLTTSSAQVYSLISLHVNGKKHPLFKAENAT
jgi:hypothetical protein